MSRSEDKIAQMVAAGTITPAQAAELLGAMHPAPKPNPWRWLDV